MTDSWRFLSGAVTGAEHARKGSGCEDSFAVSQSGSGVIVAVADGGSRLRLSALGSSLAASLAVQWAQARLDGDGTAGWPTDAKGWTACAREVLEGVLGTFASLAAGLSTAVPGTEPRDLGTTLTLVMAAPPWLAVVSVGDGFVVTRSGDGHFDLLMPPDSGATTADVVAEQPGRTTFITSPGAARAAQVAVAHIPDLTGIAVSTDGLREVGLEYAAAVAQHPHEVFFRPLFARADRGDDQTALLRLLASERVCGLTSDDKTLVVGVPR
jgi:hypothetical protein